ncbi:hypothetical protein C3747_32g175 [Trypanosoma cruzi]|uniref:SRP9 domain-containing protein n=2 Tax=Trypanosoma cruzi TaxID=5693 RepID=Q4E337_TRYCC|nr:hypothetical protein, conserved [Trypanosoma cruzi]EAN99215.1 hypothetical protein, conserved [Trypanosoma cruzi]PWV15009.1 hypothetical protein C3747_32g175 [Trypanosoma cruzi]RNC46821.1 hypothetical protein TcCL_NonESM03312 [Trypanosoma cruzi]|eukprot:XP_821066.1 hypothetical protein [Trypanosoma cruzi strain CL Brener]
MVKLELREFAEATRRMVQLSGVKKSRLMLRARPNSGRRTFVLKSTDGRTTLTTRVTHQGELKIVEGIVNDFVGSCTAAVASPGGGKPTLPAPSLIPTPAPGKQADGGTGGNSGSNLQPASSGGKGGSKQGGKSAGGGTNANQQQQQQQHGSKKRKGGRR